MINPYAGIDLSDPTKTERILSVSHQHLSNSSQANAQGVFDAVYATGVRHFPLVQYRPSLITPYDTSTDKLKYTLHGFPAYTSIQTIKSDYQAVVNGHSDVLSSPNTEHLYPLLLFNGSWNKWSNIHMNGVGSAFESGLVYGESGRYNQSGLECPYSEGISKILSGLEHADGGGVIINHPEWTEQNKNFNFDVERYVRDCLDYDPRVLGTDIIENADQGSMAFDAPLIDNILSTGRRCWIFCQADWGTNGHKGRNELLIPLPEGRNLTRAEKEHECLKAYRNGAFFGRYGNSTLSITNVSFEENVFSITAAHADGIKIITDGVTTNYTGTSASQTIDANAKYVRAMAYTNRDNDADWGYHENDVYKDIVFTNPIMIHEFEYRYDPAYDVKPQPGASKYSMLYWG